jgi:hypothetical protein
MSASRRHPTVAPGGISNPWHVEEDGCNLWIHAGSAVVAAIPQTPQGRIHARLIVAAPALRHLLTAVIARPDLATDPAFQQQVRAVLRTIEADGHIDPTGDRNAGASS